jgi:hypothetical protein
VLAGRDQDDVIVREVIEFQMMELGIPRSELTEMTDEEVIRKWVVGLELAERRKKSIEADSKTSEGK